MSPKVPRAYLDARRSEILEAAFNCFIENGFHNTTMQDIYKATNLSPGAVYNYFRSKEDIVATAVEMSQQRNTAMITEAASKNQEEALINLGRLFLTLARQIDLTKAASVDLALYSEAHRNKRIREALYTGQETVKTKLIEFVKYNQQIGVINSKLNTLAITQVLISIFQGIELQTILDPNFDLDLYGTVFEAIVNGTFSRPPEEIKKRVKSVSKNKLATGEVRK